MDSKTADWRKNGKHLPNFLRDFHDQKDLFRAIHETVNVESHPYAKDVDWITGQCYVIDVFLWFMARHGYFLKKSHAGGFAFDDIETTLAAVRNSQLEASTELLRQALSGKSSKNEGADRA